MVPVVRMFLLVVLACSSKIRIILLAMLACLQVFGALPNGTVWEVRTLGNANNGGCYVRGSTGTDFSQQNAAQYSFTDLVLPTSTTGTSVSHSFVATDVGNCLHITAGTNFTQGWYQIVSVAVGTATFDRAAGTAASTGGTYAVGGAIVSPVVAAAQFNIGSQMWIKNDGTYTVTTTITLGNGGNDTSFTELMQGYTTTRGDTGRAIITTSTNSTPLIVSRNNTAISNLTLSNTAAVRSTGISVPTTLDSVKLANMSLTGFTNGISVPFQFGGFLLVNVEINASTAQGFLQASLSPAYGVTLIDCWIHGSGGNGIELQGVVANIEIFGTVVSSNTGDGIRLTNAQVSSGNPLDSGFIIFNSVLAYNTSDGIEVLGATRYKYATSTNSVYTGNGVNDINMANVPGFAVSTNNAFRESNTNWITGTGTVTLTADPFTSTTNFLPNATAGGGAAIKATGFPGAASYGTGFADIGAVQSQAASGQRVYGGAN